MVTVEIFEEKVIFFPENTVEAYGIDMILTYFSNITTDPDIINKNFGISKENILEDEKQRRIIK